MTRARDSRGRFVSDERTAYDKFFSDFSQMVSDEVGVNVGYFTQEVAAYAAVNEFGSNNGEIPERPFMRSAFDANQNKYEGLMKKAASRALSGADPIKAMFSVGNEIRNDIIRSIVSWSDPPNADSTVATKKVNNPLVNTGQMQRALNVEVGKVIED